MSDAPHDPPAGGPPPDDVDRRFREIVAGLSGPDPAPPEEPDDETTVPVDDEGYALPRAGVAGTAARWRGAEEAEPEEEHFVPPPTPPLPAGDLHFWAIVAGLTLGPLLLVLSNALPVLDESWGWVGIGMAVAGFVLLVLRQPRNQREDDWGAQV
jgi:hypothetical protein